MDRLLNKRAQSAGDTIFAIATIFALGIIAVIGVYTYNSFVDIAQTTTVINQSQPALDVIEEGQTTNDLLDYLILTVLIGFAIAMLITGWFVDVHTVFFPVYLILLLIGMIMAGVFQYAWTQISDSSTFTAITTASFPITVHIFNNLHIYYIIIGGLALIATYAKTRQQ